MDNLKQEFMDSSPAKQGTKGMEEPKSDKKMINYAINT